MNTETNIKPLKLVDGAPLFDPSQFAPILRNIQYYKKNTDGSLYISILVDSDMQIDYDKAKSIFRDDAVTHWQETPKTVKGVRYNHEIRGTIKDKTLSDFIEAYLLMP